MNTQAAAPKFVVQGWHVLALILGFFAFIVAVNIAFAIYAVRSFPGEEVQSPYQQGLRYNETLAERRAQAALGWQADATLQADGADAAVVVILRTRAGAPLNNITVTGALRWPTDAANDRSLSFTGEGDGRYRAPVTDLAPGRWRLEANAADEQSGALDFNADFTWR